MMGMEWRRKQRELQGSNTVFRGQHKSPEQQQQQQQAAKTKAKGEGGGGGGGGSSSSSYSSAQLWPSRERTRETVVTAATDEQQ